MSQDGRAPDPATLTEGETLDLPEGMQPFTPGQILGERYQILDMLGRGGMGEVWHAFDLKLRVDVALKALRSDLFKSPRRLETLRQEVRAAREVVSPNVCRIFDLIEVEGRELVSMEFVDGATLLGVMHERGPLELKEAQNIASQFLAGLESIHQAGLVHRDIKPENIMLTRAGRVVVMDFGLARQEAEGGGSVSGTPAYMAPEHAAGHTLDPRADVYSAGVVLAEMVSPEGIKSLESRQSVWDGVRSEPVTLPDSPWAPVLKKAVAKDREGRFNSAHTLTRALEDVTLRVEGAEDLHPYPGLASFTEEDAEYFFGREAEVEEMWRKLERPHLLAIAGPSGAGKTSFLRAGMIPSAPAGWRIVRCTPGNAPYVALRELLAGEMSGDSDAMRLLVKGDDHDALVVAIDGWRQCHTRAVLILDQFEELFTLNPPEVQHHFAELLRRFVLEADVFVMLSMRDDFLFACHEHEALRRVVSDLSLLGPPVGGALRRALVQPATKCGYRFEDDELVEEMLAEVEGERGALPLLAFAAARLWEKRDRETGLLTRQAYHEIGGVSGALAQHAEGTVDRIGADRVAIVRELFRNLVTAEGTRAVREWDELLSVFSDSQSESPEEVLRELIDARLLTSYEVREEDREPVRRVEIIHESLLANWPRLVRWQTQDADAAQLRDQLRQAARTWDDHDRTDDTLWTGSAYREFAVWRERYPGGLTETEEAFASAMTSLATRRRRRRRVAAASVMIFLTVVATAMGALWRRSVLETRRAEAAKLLALAEVQFDDGPTEALAYATSSLELADTEEARVFAMRALWAGPPALAIDLRQPGDPEFWVPTFSPDGRWLAVSGLVNEFVLVYGEGGGQPILLGGHAVSAAAASSIRCRWSREGLLVTGHPTETRARVWSMPGGRLVREIELGGSGYWQVVEDRLFAGLPETDPQTGHRTFRLRSWGLQDGGPDDLGEVDWTDSGGSAWAFDPGGGAWIYAKDDGVYSRPLPIKGGVPDTMIGRHHSEGVEIHHWRRPQGLFSRDSGGEIIQWVAAEGTSVPGQRLRKPKTASPFLLPGPGGRWTAELTGAPRLHLWDLAGLAGASPRVLRRSNPWIAPQVDFHPRGDWVIVTTGNRREVTFWPLTAPLPFVVKAAVGWKVFEFTPDGRHILAGDRGSGQRFETQQLRLWPLPGDESTDAVDLSFPPNAQSGFRTVTIDPQGAWVLTTGFGHNIFLLSTSEEEPRRLEGFPANDLVHAGAFSPSGRLVAAASMISDGQATLRVWDLETGEVKVFDQPKDPEAYEGYYILYLAFVDETTLYTAGANGLLRWDLEAGSYEQTIRAPPEGRIGMRLTFDRQKMLTWEEGGSRPGKKSIDIREMRTGEVWSRSIPRNHFKGALNPDGTIWASGSHDGLIGVGQAQGGEPHLLLGHEGAVDGIAISPDLRWIASSSQDKTLRLWPMPDLSKPPLHTLPHDELIAKLKTLTNLRVVRDEESATGWKLEVGPFPGWAEVPEW